MTDTDDFLITPLDEHHAGLRGGIEAAAAEIAARVEAWSTEVTV